MKVRGTTKVVGLLGWPVEHSMSPAMHNAAFREAGLNYTYVPFPVQPEHLAKAVDAIRALNLAGANVTIPHKVAVMQYLDEIDEDAQKIGAVNTIVNVQGRLVGYNTDGQGFIRSLAEQGIGVKAAKVVLLGAGGAARAVVEALLSAGAASVTIAARSGDKANHLAGHYSSPAVTGIDWQSDVLTRRLAECDLLINATPLGMAPAVEKIPPVNWPALASQTIVCDLIYNPLMTRFLQQAKERGHQVVTGEGMLAGQGALAFQIWTKTAAPYDVMAGNLLQQLKEQQENC